MARDPDFSHTDDDLRSGLFSVQDTGAAGSDDLDHELVHLGLVWRHDDGLVLTPEGRAFLRGSPSLWGRSSSR